MFATRLRCVSITPFEVPVVPLENGSTARSSAGSTSAPVPPGSASGSDPIVYTRSGEACASDPRSGSATTTARASALASCEAISSAVSRGLSEVTIPPSATTAWKAITQSGLLGPSRPTASPWPIPSAARPAAARADAVGELGVGGDPAAGAVDQGGLVAAGGGAAEHVLGEGDRRDLDVGVRAAQGHARSLVTAQPTGGGGVETASSGSAGGSPLSSKVPSDSSSIPMTMWRTERAR